MQTTTNRSIRQHYQTGLSLVELMIAMAISVTLLAGITQIVIANKDTYSFQQSQSINQENSRFAYYFIDQILSRAGYITAPQNSLDQAFPAAVATAQCSAFLAGQVVASSLEGNGVCFRYQPNNATELDCAGNAIAGTNSFVTRLFFSTANNSLMCGAQGAAAVELVSNIENMQVSYRVNTSGTTVANLAAPSTTQWRDITAIQVNVLTVSDNNSSDTPQVYRFPLSAATTTTATDRRVYRSSLKTVTLRNSVL